MDWMRQLKQPPDLAGRSSTQLGDRRPDSNGLDRGRKRAYRGGRTWAGPIVLRRAFARAAAPLKIARGLHGSLSVKGWHRIPLAARRLTHEWSRRGLTRRAAHP